MTRLLRFPAERSATPVVTRPAVYYVDPDVVLKLTAKRRTLGLGEAFRTAILTARTLERWHACNPARDDAPRQARWDARRRDLRALGRLCLDLLRRAKPAAADAWWPELERMLQSVADGAGPTHSVGDIAAQLAAAERVAVRPVARRPGVLRRLLDMVRPLT